MGTEAQTCCGALTRVYSDTVRMHYPGCRYATPYNTIPRPEDEEPEATGGPDASGKPLPVWMHRAMGAAPAEEPAPESDPMISASVLVAELHAVAKQYRDKPSAYFPSERSTEEVAEEVAHAKIAEAFDAFADRIRALMTNPEE